MIQTTTACAFLIAANVAAWIWAAFALAGHPALWSLAVLAWLFGLRHAFDADHIAAIDNVVRKLLQQGRSPAFAGLYFSLGHSTVVVLACIAVNTPARRLLERIRDFGGVAGTIISAAFLLLMGLANLEVLRRTWVSLRRGPVQTGASPVSPAGGGLLARICGPLLRLVSRSWHMYLVGLLFGLGFDTATEVGLLGIAAQGGTQVGEQGISAVSVLVFPALFTAAMSLLDTTDSVLMTRVYGWAFTDPLRRTWYNLAVTAASVVAALCIGGIEVLGLI